MPGRRQGKQIARLTDTQPGALPQLLVHTARSAAAGWIQQHAQFVAVTPGRCAAQRVLTDQAVGQLKINMGSGAKGR